MPLGARQLGDIERHPSADGSLRLAAVAAGVPIRQGSPAVGRQRARPVRADTPNASAICGVGLAAQPRIAADPAAGQIGPWTIGGLAVLGLGGRTESPMDSTGGGELGSPPPVLGPALPCEPEVFSLHVVAKHDPKSLVDRRRDVVVLVAEDRLRRGWVQG